MSQQRSVVSGVPEAVKEWAASINTLKAGHAPKGLAQIEEISSPWRSMGTTSGHMAAENGRNETRNAIGPMMGYTESFDCLEKGRLLKEKLRATREWSELVFALLGANGYRHRRQRLVADSRVAQTIAMVASDRYDKHVKEHRC